jgi:DNA (cytosine-5)-methyltransferase 1
VGAYYNEKDAYAAQWLRNLIAAGHIAGGDVDERSIAEVRPDDLKGYAQCHFFAGIGGWSRALRLSLWPDDRHVWTGSCPCQPFSAAGQGKAADDERHLWPAWFSLIRECRPSVVFGEQVEAAIGWGWLDAVFADLEAEGYACGTAVLPACGVGAPHIRQRLWFVGHAKREGLPQRERNAGADSQAMGTSTRQRPWETGSLVWLPCTDGKARPTQSGILPLAHGVPARVGKLRAAGNAIVPQVAAEFVMAAMP